MSLSAPCWVGRAGLLLLPTQLTKGGCSPLLSPLPSPLVPGEEGGCHRGLGWSVDESEQIASAFTTVGL